MKEETMHAMIERASELQRVQSVQSRGRGMNGEDY